MAKKSKIIYESNCCKSEYWSENNGLWIYHVCKNCLKKCAPKKPDMRLNVNKLKYGKKTNKVSKIK
jgi:hypothetical protein